MRSPECALHVLWWRVRLRRLSGCLSRGRWRLERTAGSLRDSAVSGWERYMSVLDPHRLALLIRVRRSSPAIRRVSGGLRSGGGGRKGRRTWAVWVSGSQPISCAIVVIAVTASTPVNPDNRVCERGGRDSSALPLSLFRSTRRHRSAVQATLHSCKARLLARPWRASAPRQTASVSLAPLSLVMTASFGPTSCKGQGRLTQMYPQPLDRADRLPSAPAVPLPRPPPPPTPPSSRSVPPTRTTRTKAGTQTGATKSTATRLPPTMHQTMTSTPTPTPSSKRIAMRRTRETTLGQRSGPPPQRTRPRAKGKGKPKHPPRARERGKQELHPLPTPSRKSGSPSVAPVAAASRLRPRRRPRRLRRLESRLVRQRRAAPYRESTSDKTATTATSRCDPTKPRGRSTLSRRRVTSSSKTSTRSPSTRPTSSSRSPNRSRGRNTSTSTS